MLSRRIVFAAAAILAGANTAVADDLPTRDACYPNRLLFGTYFAKRDELAFFWGPSAPATQDELVPRCSDRFLGLAQSHLIEIAATCSKQPSKVAIHIAMFGVAESANGSEVVRNNGPDRFTSVVFLRDGDFDWIPVEPSRSRFGRIVVKPRVGGVAELTDAARQAGASCPVPDLK